MSTQGALTVGRTGHVPMWPFVVTVLVVAIGVVGLTIGLTSSKDRTPELAGSVLSTEAVANSSVAIREGGAYAPSAAVPKLVPADFASERTDQIVARYAAIAGLGRLDPADFASTSPDRVLARYAAMARFGRDATAGAIVIDGWVCHQCR
jgi:hypothetical protein